MKKTFKNWLLEQVVRNDEIGDLGRDTERAIRLGWFDKAKTSEEELGVIQWRGER